MKLEFILLVIDDAPDNVEPAILALEDHLNSQGFHLKRKVATDLSQQGLEKLADSQGRNYDLVMVDYNLGMEKRDGAVVASQLRQRLPYVDMIFYSSMPESELHKYLADQKVPGVFPAIRENLVDALKGVTDTVIRKAMDLNHMRGIAMAEVAEMDVQMTQTLVKVFQSNDKRIDAAKDRVIERLRKGMENNSQRLQNHLDNGGLPAIVDDSLLYSLASKYQAIRGVVKCLPSELREELKVVNSYVEDIIHNRNMLAHVREDIGDDGQTILRTVGHNNAEVVINEDWMSDFRQKLLRHREALNVICKTLEKRFGGT